MEESISDGGSLFLDGQGVSAVMAESIACFGKGALLAVGIGGNALEGAHLHHGLVEAAGMVGGHPLFA